MAENEPVTARARELRARVSEARWAQVTRDAERRARVVEEVASRRAEDELSLRATVAKVAPDVEWATYLHWRRRYEGREGPPWERLLDERVPPPADRVPEAVRVAACMLRRVDRSMNAETARGHLVAQFADVGSVSDTWLRRVWAAADLGYVEDEDGGRVVGEESVYFAGGGGLALLAAADVELGASVGLGRAVQSAGEEQAAAQQTPKLRGDLDGARDDHGRFTAEYNGQWRTGTRPGQADARLASDADKRGHVELARLPTLKHRPETLATRLLCMGVTPMLTERRGFAGLDGPAGAWLGVLGGTAYMPATLDKTLTELGLLGVDSALWSDHASRWCEVSRRWTASEAPWVQWAFYIDATADPYWTRRYAKAGPVSRIGKVMPCLTRVAIASGAGVPLLVETHAGVASLKKRLIPALARLDEILGVGGEVGRLTVVDSEVATAGLMWALHDTADRIFITVLKGGARKGAAVRERGEWTAFRTRDEVREVEVDLNGKDAPEGGITLRGVEMRRADSRWPGTTLFVTNADPEDIPTTDVPAAYLARWPRQEQLFRDSRNGGGLDRSHGYGGEYVSHVALETKLERARRRVEVGNARRAKAETVRDLIDDGTRDNERSVRTEAVRLAGKESRLTSRELEKRRAKLERLEAHPREIYERDTGRDSTMTCLKLNALMLLEFVLREYFGGPTIEWRTFIEHFVMLPVTVRTTRRRCLYELHANPRQPVRMAQLAAALEEVTERRLHRGDRLLVFRLVDPVKPGS